MLKRPWFRTGALAVAVALLLTACGGAASSPGGQSVGAAKKVKLGLGAPLTGSSGDRKSVV